jgi:hypothetical protein
MKLAAHGSASTHATRPPKKRAASSMNFRAGINTPASLEGAVLDACITRFIDHNLIKSLALQMDIEYIVVVKQFFFPRRLRMARTRKTPALIIPKPANKRFSYEHRSGQNTRAAKIVFDAFNDQPEFIEDDDGHMIRQWREHEMKHYTNGDIRDALRGRSVVEPEDLLEYIPERAIGYSVTKGWLFPDGPWFRVTRKAAAELDLPRSVCGRKITFYDSGLV